MERAEAETVQRGKTEDEQYEEKEQAQRRERAEELAGQVMQLARDSIVVNLRFLDAALSRIKTEIRHGLGGESIVL